MNTNTYFVKYKANPASDWYEGFVQDANARAVWRMILDQHPGAVIVTCCKIK